MLTAIKKLTKGQWFGVHALLYVFVMLLDSIFGFLPEWWGLLIFMWSLVPWVLYVEYNHGFFGKKGFYMDLLTGLPVLLGVSAEMLGLIPRYSMDVYIKYYLFGYVVVLIGCLTFGKKDS